MMNRTDTLSKYTFDKKITKEALLSYLSRSIIDSLLFYTDSDPAIVEDSMRMLLKIGAKYVGRAYCIWLPGKKYDVDFTKLKENIERIHEADPEMVLETCIFETAWKGMDEIPIPEWAFKEFGLEVESRCFDHTKMIFEDGSMINQFGDGISVPDITRIETQLFFYTRFRQFIDLGFEGFHIGQVDLIGHNDEPNSFPCWAKVLQKAREYAATNARRHFILINGHTPRHNFWDKNKNLLMDFASFPLRLMVDPTETDHESTPENPQRAVINLEYGDTIYTRSYGGKTPSGWDCKWLPYFVELDNYGGHIDNLNIAKHLWGYDEISWFANQPDDFRRKFIRTIYKEVKAFGTDGFFEMPGLRTAYSYKKNMQKTYFANNSEFLADGFSDEDTIIQVWDECSDS